MTNFSLPYLIETLKRELNRTRQHALDGSGVVHVIAGLEFFLKSIRTLSGEADLEAWFRSKEAQGKPEGLKYSSIKTLINSSSMQESVISCFWDGKEETRPKKGKPLTIWRCRVPAMAANIYIRYVAVNGLFPHNSQVPISFAMQLYAEFVLFEPVDYTSMRPGTGAGKGRMGHQRTGVRKREGDEFSNTCVLPPTLRRMRGWVEESVPAAASSTQTVERTSSYSLQETTKSHHTASSAQRNASLPAESSSSIEPEPVAPHEEVNVESKSSRWLMRGWNGQWLEGGQSSHHEDDSLLLQETKGRLPEHNLHAEEAAQTHKETNQQLQVLKEQLNEAKRQLQETQDTRQQVEETKRRLQEMEETNQQLGKQLQERDALLEKTKGLLEARDQELDKATSWHTAQTKALREEIISKRIALHNSRHIFGQCMHFGHNVHERKGAPSIALHLVDPVDLTNRSAPLSEMVCARVLDHICSICRADFNCLGWFTLGCGHSFHLHCLTQHLVRAASCQFCKTAVPVTSYEGLGIGDLYPDNH